MNQGQDPLGRLVNQIRNTANRPGGAKLPPGAFAGGGALIAVAFAGIGLYSSLFNGS